MARLITLVTLLSFAALAASQAFPSKPRMFLTAQYFIK